jgi:hypothetical protein
LRATERSFIEALVLAVLTSACGKRFLRSIHVSLKNPVTNFITLSDRKKILFG